jgi:hypothetical protein
MKKTLMLVMLLVLALPGRAGAQNTLLGEDFSSGGYGGPGIRIGTLNGDLAVQVGGQGGWVIGKTLVIGGAGYGMVTEHELTANSTTYAMDFGYGGLLLEYLHKSDEVFHGYLALIIGGGGISLRDTSLPSSSDDVDDDAVLVLEPSLHLGINMTRTMRIGLGAGYRIVSGLKETWETDYGLAAADLGGPFAGLTFRFGKY